MGKRDWAELPRDILTLIFRKVGGIGVLCAAQAVCRPWRQLALDPEFWRIIDMRGHSILFNFINKEVLTQIAVDRCDGHVEELYLDYFGSENLLNYVSDRLTGLKRLVLKSTKNISKEELAQFVGRCSLLEELQLTNCFFGNRAYTAVGQAHPQLKCLRLNAHCYELPSPWHGVHSDVVDLQAIEIADNMPQLRELQLIGNLMTNKGLHAILDKCLQLESLDIRLCFNVNLDASLRAKLANIKSVKLPLDSTADYEFCTELQEVMFNEEEYNFEYSDPDVYEDMCDFLHLISSLTDFTVADYFDNDDSTSYPFPLM